QTAPGDPFPRKGFVQVWPPYLAASSAITLIALRVHPWGIAKGIAMNDLTGRTALVTGGASGIGAACARELAGRGATVTIADVDEAGAKELAAEIGGHVWLADLLDVASLENLQLE